MFSQTRKNGKIFDEFLSRNFLEISRIFQEFSRIFEKISPNFSTNSSRILKEFLRIFHKKILGILENCWKNFKKLTHSLAKISNFIFS